MAAPDYSAFSRKDLLARIAELEGKLKRAAATNYRLSLDNKAWKVFGHELVESGTFSEEGLKRFLNLARRSIADAETAEGGRRNTTGGT